MAAQLLGFSEGENWEDYERNGSTRFCFILELRRAEGPSRKSRHGIRLGAKREETGVKTKKGGHLNRTE